jgi:Trp operon repressor
MTYASPSSPAQIEERRRLVASMLARSMTETEIASELGVDQATISRDKKSIKEESQQFVFSLAKQDLAFHYKQKLDSLEQTKREAWNIYKNTNEQTLNTDKIKLLSLKMIITADEAAIKLLSEGPGIMNMQMMETRLNDLEQQEQE